MNNNHEQPDWQPNKRISWAMLVLMTAIACLLGGGLSPLFFPMLGRNAFWIALGVGISLGLIVNLLRPKYEKAGRFWKPIYEFFLKQMPPPD